MRAHCLPKEESAVAMRGASNSKALSERMDLSMSQRDMRQEPTDSLHLCSDCDLSRACPAAAIVLRHSRAIAERLSYMSGPNRVALLQICNGSRYTQHSVIRARR